MARRGVRFNEPDHYGVLGVAATASSEQLKAAYRDLAKRYHPDLYRTYVQKVWATKKLQEINAAYAVLSNAETRHAYDYQRVERPSSQATKPSQRKPLDLWWSKWIERPAFVITIVTWVITSFTLFLWWRPADFIHNIGSTLLTLFDALLLSWVIVWVATFVVLVPLGLLSVGFEGAWTSAKAKPTRVKSDLGRRLFYLSLLLIVWLPIVIDIQIPVLQKISATIAVYTLIFVPFFLGEFMALIAYLVWARKVVAKTQALAVME